MASVRFKSKKFSALQQFITDNFMVHSTGRPIKISAKYREAFDDIVFYVSDKTTIYECIYMDGKLYRDHNDKWDDVLIETVFTTMAQNHYIRKASIGELTFQTL